MKQFVAKTVWKRVLSCIMAVSLIFSVFLTTKVIAETNDAKKMMEISGEAGRYWLKFKTLDADAQYKAYYKYSLEKGSFGASAEATLRFVVRFAANNFYQHRLTSHFNQPDYSFEAMDDGEDGWSDVNLTFTPKNSTSDHYVGFEIVGDTKVYIADFKLYKIKDGTETLVTEGFSDFIKTALSNKNVTTTEKTYDELLFKDVMLNIKGNSATSKDSYYGTSSNYTMRLPQDTTAAENNKQYRVYFKYRINKGELLAVHTDATFNFATYLKAQQYYIQNATHYLVDQNFTSITEGEDGWSDISLTFITTKNGTFDLGFHFFSETDIDVADFRLYLTVDGKEKLVDIGFDSFVARNTYSRVTVEKSPYNAEIFKDDGKDDIMYKLDAVNGSKLQKVFDQGSKETNKSLTYRAYFKYRAEEGVFGTSDNRTIFFKDLWQGQYQHHTSHNYDGLYGMIRDDGEDGYSDITLNWTTRENQKHHIGFTFNSDAVIYITDFRLYVVDGENERLIQKGLVGFSDKDTGATVTEMSYDEDFFKDRMLHITAQEKTRFTARMLELKEGETYRIYMQYAVAEGMFGAAEDSNTIGVSNMMAGRYTHHSSHVSEGLYAFTRGNGKEGVSDLDYTFTIRGTNNHNIGWWFRGAGEIYLYNFRLYKIVGGEEILVEQDLSNFLERSWDTNANTEGFIETEYLPYDETLFIDNALQLYNTDGNSGVFGTNVQLSGGKEYTFSFLSYYYRGTVRHNKINVVLREVLGQGKPKKVYYTTDPHNTEAKQFKVNTPSLSLTEYVFTAPADGEYSLGIEMIDEVSAYFADFKLIDNTDTVVNLLTNGSFANNLTDWHSENNSAGKGSGHFYDGFLAQSFTCSPLRYSELFDKELKENQMLHFKNAGDMRRWIMVGARGAKTGETYQVQFKIGGIPTPLYCIAASGQGIPFNTSCSRVSLEWFDDYYIAVYEFKIPEKDENGNVINDTKGIKIGVTVQSGDTGCILDAKLWKKDDETKTNVLRNGDFKYGLAEWGMFFEDGLAYIQANETAPSYAENEIGSFIRVIDHDVSVYEMFIDDSRFNDGEWWSKNDVLAEGTVTSFGKVTGKLINHNGAGLSGVKLVLSSAEKLFTAVTDKNGAYSFKVPEGYYMLYMIDHNGKHRETGFESGVYGNDIAEVVITCDSSSQDVIQEEYKPVGSINGGVYTPDIKTVPGLTVYIGDVASVVTDDDGKFAFADIPVGEYELYTVSKSGEKYVFRTVMVKENVDTGVKLKFDPPTAAADNSNQNSFNIWWVIIPLLAAILIAGGITAFIIIKKKKQSV